MTRVCVLRWMCVSCALNSWTSCTQNWYSKTPLLGGTLCKMLGLLSCFFFFSQAFVYTRTVRRWGLQRGFAKSLYMTWTICDSLCVLVHCYHTKCKENRSLGGGVVAVELNLVSVVCTIIRAQSFLVLNNWLSLRETGDLALDFSFFCVAPGNPRYHQLSENSIKGWMFLRLWCLCLRYHCSDLLYVYRGLPRQYRTAENVSSPHAIYSLLLFAQSVVWLTIIIYVCGSV